MEIISRMTTCGRQFGEVVGTHDNGGQYITWIDLNECTESELRQMYTSCNSRDLQNAILKILHTQ